MCVWVGLFLFLFPIVFAWAFFCLYSLFFILVFSFVHSFFFLSNFLYLGKIRLFFSHNKRRKKSL